MFKPLLLSALLGPLLALAPAAGGGCRLALAHDRVPAACADAMEARWLGALYGLRETLVAWRQAASRGVPVSAG